MLSSIICAFQHKAVQDALLPLNVQLGVTASSYRLLATADHFLSNPLQSTACWF